MLDLSVDQLEFLRTSLIDHCLSHGLVVRPQPSVSSNPHSCLVAHAPVALHPTPFPKSAFLAARTIQKSYNTLYASIADNEPFLHTIMVELSRVDDFMKQLWELHLAVKAEGIVQPLSLGLFRSDYLLHAAGGAAAVIKQVEFNTISASFASLAAKTSELHRAMLHLGAFGHDHTITKEALPNNAAIDGLVDGLAAAHAAYKEPKARVVFIVQDGEKNAFDQRWLEYGLLERHTIHTHRVSFTHVQDSLTLDPVSRTLYVNAADGSRHEVSVVYYRAGYGPEDYPTEKEWSSRSLIERSTAIKCPTILTQLAGSKKIQQVLSEPGTVERFVTDADEARALRDTFVGIHTLDASEAGQKAIEIALHEPDRYVLKPQREGGGHNIYRTAIPGFLKSIPEPQWPGYILMELIEAPTQENSIVRAGEVFPASVISELGIYGTILWDTKTSTVLHNTEAGHLLRTKSVDTDEGGVAAGFACIDSPFLV